MLVHKQTPLVTSPEPVPNPSLRMDGKIEVSSICRKTPALAVPLPFQFLLVWG